MKKTIFFALFIGLAISNQSALSQEYKCKIEKSVGFYYNTKLNNWESFANESIDDSISFILSRELSDAKSNLKAEWILSRPPQSQFKKYCGSFSEDDILSCNDGVIFSFSKKTKRFLYTIHEGYIFNDESINPNLNNNESLGERFARALAVRMYPVHHIGRCSVY
jgi:hypothetical protein